MAADQTRRWLSRACPQASRGAMQNQPALRVVVVVQRPTVTTQSKYAGYEKLVFEMASPLLRSFPRRFQIYTTKTQRNLYIHSKVIVVDHMILSICSANWNRRSMTSDSELAASIVDTQFMVSVDVDDHGKAVQVVMEHGKLPLVLHSESLHDRHWIIASSGGGSLFQRLAALSDRQCAQCLHTAPRHLTPLEQSEFSHCFAEFTLHVVDPDDLNHAQHNSDSGDEDAEG